VICRLGGSAIILSFLFIFSCLFVCLLLRIVGLSHLKISATEQHANTSLLQRHLSSVWYGENEDNAGLQVA
jgi:hypothetical protein